MAKTPLSGKAQTVLGPVDGDAMGITLPHEHLLIDFKVMFKEPEAAADKGRALAPVTMANLGWVRQNFSSSLDNLRLLDEDVARDEALLFKQAGGQTMVDPTNGGLSRDPAALARIARATGLHIVMGAGYYVQAAHPAGAGPARTSTTSRARSWPTSPSAWATPASAPASSARSAAPGRGRMTRRRWCARRWRPSGRPARR